MDSTTPSLYDKVCANPILGRGRFGGVYRCRNRTHGTVAIKVSKRRSLQEMSAPDEVFAMSVMSRHQNVLSLIAWMQDDEWVYVMTELVGTGTTLMTLLRGQQCEWSHLPDAKHVSPKPGDHHGFSEFNAWSLFWQLAGAVGHCHAHGVAHRDVKPDNVLVRAAPGVSGDQPLGRQVQLVLCDFGFATAVTPGQPKITFPGTFAFAAPELVMGQPYEAWHPDIWSLGVCLYVLLVGHFPFGRAETPENRARIVRAAPNMDIPSASVPDAARPLLRSIFSVVGANRPSVGEIMEHPWMVAVPPVNSLVAQ